MCPPSWPPERGDSALAAPADRPDRRGLGRRGRAGSSPRAAGRRRGHTMALRLLSDRRDGLVAEPTGALSRLHVLLCDLHRAAPSRT